MLRHCPLQFRLQKRLPQQLHHNCQDVWHGSTQQQLQRRLVSGAGGNKYGTEESHIAKTLTWLREKEPRLMVHVDKITTVGCDFLPGPAFRTIYRAKFRLLVLTHGDVLSARALQHQIALAEDLAAQHSHNQYFPAAIFVVNLQMVQKQKQLKHLIDAMYGAFYLNHMKQRAFVVSGIPNVGKSSLILPLTRGRTLMVKKKRHYHLPKVGPIAGLTLGIKAHVLQCPNHNQEISLYDTPGLRYVATLLDMTMCESAKHNHVLPVVIGTHCHAFFPSVNQSIRS
jgi:50S ribosome-binding GTPase